MQKSTVQHLLVQNISVIPDSCPSFPSAILLLGCVLTNKQYSTLRCMALLGKCG